MRSITNIQINKNEKNVTMFLTYNNDNNDNGFETFETVETALKSLPNDPYFPIQTKTYTLVEIQNFKETSRSTINLK